MSFNNVKWHASEGNSHYEKFADGRVVCIDDEIPFEIPAGWEWARLGVIVELNPRNKAEDSCFAGYIPMTYINAGYFSSFRFDTRKWSEVKSGMTHLADGDVAFAKITPCFQNRKSMILSGLPNGIAGGTTELNVLRPYGETMIREYLLYFVKTHYFIGEASFKGTAGQQRVKTDYTENKLIPIPPLNEQIRIVQKIAELIPVAEKYEVSQNILDRLNASISDSLRKSILQEAIQGRIVPQDSNDEPASVLLERIYIEKQKLLKEGKLKKKDIIESTIFKGEDNKYYERVGTEVTEIELPFQFPDSWAIVRLQTICALTDGERRTGDGICLDAKYLRGKSSGEHLHSGKYVHLGDNIILVDGENSGEVFTVPVDGYMGSTFKRLWVSENLHLPYVLSCIRFYKDELRNSKKGAAIPHLNKDIFRNLLIGIPPLKEQVRIVNKLETIDSQL